MILGRIALCAILLVAMLPARADQVVTFRVPVTLQNLHPGVAKFAVACELRPMKTSARTDQPVVNRAFSGTVEVKLSVTDAESLSATGYGCSLFLYPGDGSGYAPTQHQDLGTPAIHAKPGTPFKVVVEGPLAPTASTATQKGAAAVAAPAAGGATPAWGAIGTPSPTPVSPPAASRGSLKSALPGTAPSK